MNPSETTIRCSSAASSVRAQAQPGKGRARPTRRPRDYRRHAHAKQILIGAATRSTDADALLGA
jgi:hypothetical protein